jgi:hypothetical protein
MGINNMTSVTRAQIVEWFKEAGAYDRDSDFIGNLGEILKREAPEFHAGVGRVAKAEHLRVQAEKE